MLGSTILDEIDKAVENVLGRCDAEQHLMGLYKEFWNEMKLRGGTSAGFTGLSEYVFFSYIRSSIEKHIGKTFEPFSPKPSSEVYSYRLDSIRLTHDVSISYIDETLSNYRIDIALFLVQEGRASIIAAFEIKTYVSSRTVLNNVFKRFRDLWSETDCKFYPILYEPQYCSEVNLLSREFGDRFFPISKKETYENQVSINKAVATAIKDLGY